MIFDDHVIKQNHGLWHKTITWHFTRNHVTSSAWSHVTHNGYLMISFWSSLSPRCRNSNLVPIADIWLDRTEVVWDVRGRVVWKRVVNSSTCWDDLYFTTWSGYVVICWIVANISYLEFPFSPGDLIPYLSCTKPNLQFKLIFHTYKKLSLIWNYYFSVNFSNFFFLCAYGFLFFIEHFLNI